MCKAIHQNPSFNSNVETFHEIVELCTQLIERQLEMIIGDDWLLNGCSFWQSYFHNKKKEFANIAFVDVTAIKHSASSTIIP